MQTQDHPNFSKTIRDHWLRNVYIAFPKSRKKELADDFSIGLEIEAEGPNLPPIDPERKSFWQSVAEGSLRSGLEYVFRHPLPIQAVPKALDEWANLTFDTEFYDSIRTSTHIHVNVSHLTQLQVIKIICAFWLIENALVNMHGAQRIGNLFCLRCSDAEALPMLLIDDIRKVQPFQTSGAENLRYSSLNLASLRKFGSLEFRFMKGMYKTPELLKWINALHYFVVQASKIKNINETLELARRISPLDFLEFFFPKDFVSEILKVNGSRIFLFLKENQGIVKKIITALEEPRFRKHKLSDDEDIEYVKKIKSSDTSPVYHETVWMEEEVEGVQF